MKISKAFFFAESEQIKNLKLRIFSLLVACCLSLVTRTHAFAQGLSLGIDPPILQIQAVAPAGIKAPLTIQNLSDREVNLKIELIPFKPSDQENGQVTFLLPKEVNFRDPLILQRVKFPTALSLAPGQKKDLVLQIDLPKDEPPSDYYFAIVFQTPEENQNQTNSSKATIGISANVLLSIGPKAQTKGEILEFSAPVFLEKGPVPFTVRAGNTNSFFITPSSDILIKNVFGQTVGKVDLKKENILANSVRDIGQSWNEEHPFGFYKADLTMALSDTGPILKREIFFFAFPLNTAVYILIALLIFFYILVKVRGRLN